jgi:hypothetical protein
MVNQEAGAGSAVMKYPNEKISLCLRGGVRTLCLQSAYIAVIKRLVTSPVNIIFSQMRVIGITELLNTFNNSFT